MTSLPARAPRPAQAFTIDTPDGPFTAVVSDRGVLASGWTTRVDELTALIHPTLRPPEIATDEAPSVEENQSREEERSAKESQSAEKSLSEQVHTAAEAVRAYYAGDLSAPSRVPVVQHSAEFRSQAWEALRQVPAGSPLTYTEFATAAGRPAAVRAAAGACAMNAAALFVPCHRIIRTDGTLGGFRYGLGIKQSLLTREEESHG